jgi:hypothetical protein
VCIVCIVCMQCKRACPPMSFISVHFHLERRVSQFNLDRKVFIMELNGLISHIELTDCVVRVC